MLRNVIFLDVCAPQATTITNGMELELKMALISQRLAVMKKWSQTHDAP